MGLFTYFRSLNLGAVADGIFIFFGGQLELSHHEDEAVHLNQAATIPVRDARKNEKHGGFIVPSFPGVIKATNELLRLYSRVLKVRARSCVQGINSKKQMVVWAC